MENINKETHWLIQHGAKLILGVMVLGTVTYISNLTSTVWSNEKRSLDNEKNVNPIMKTQKVMLKNQCEIMRHFKIGDKKECI